jgi:methionyl-tRNA formyltransferase
VHDLVRAVAPPYPGAFCDLPGGRLAVLRTVVVDAPAGAPKAPGVFAAGGRAYARAGDGGCVEILEAARDGRPIDANGIASLLAPAR